MVNKKKVLPDPPLHLCEDCKEKREGLPRGQLGMCIDCAYDNMGHYIEFVLTIFTALKINTDDMTKVSATMETPSGIKNSTLIMFDGDETLSRRVHKFIKSHEKNDGPTIN